jgi:hypothetical protein
VVQIEAITVEHLSTVLTSIFVSLKDTMAREFYFPSGKLIEQTQHYNTRNPDFQ